MPYATGLWSTHQLLWVSKGQAAVSISDLLYAVIVLLWSRRTVFLRFAPCVGSLVWLPGRLDRKLTFLPHETASNIQIGQNTFLRQVIYKSARLLQTRYLSDHLYLVSLKWHWRMLREREKGAYSERGALAAMPLSGAFHHNAA